MFPLEDYSEKYSREFVKDNYITKKWTKMKLGLILSVVTIMTISLLQVNAQIDWDELGIYPEALFEARAAYGQMVESPIDQFTSTSTLNISESSNESSAASWASNGPIMTTGDNVSIGDGTTLEYPFAPDVIQEDGNNDGLATCDDPILLVKVRCPVGWKLEEDEDSISFNNSSDFYTYIIIEKQHIFPIDNAADYMRDILNSERETGNIDIIAMSETSINGMQASRAEYKTTLFKTIQYFLVDAEEYLGYIIELTSSPRDFDRYVPAFERVANSFEITK